MRGHHVYGLWSVKQGSPIYVGQSVRLAARISQHVAQMGDDLTYVEYTECDSHREMDELEADLIYTLQPSLNSYGKDRRTVKHHSPRCHACAIDG